MATKPDDIPRWATDESNNAEPSEGTKDTGWVNGSLVVSSYLNWFMLLVYQWITFYQTRTRFVRARGDGIHLADQSWTSDGIVFTSGGVGKTGIFEIPAHEGDTISAIDVLVRGDGAVDANVTVMVFDDAMAENDIGTVLDSNRANAWAFLSVPLGAPYTVQADDQVHLKIVTLAAGYKIAGIRITP